MIKVKPPTVWQAVKNHTTRHVFDKMLKVKIRQTLNVHIYYSALLPMKSSPFLIAHANLLFKQGAGWPIEGKSAAP